MAKQVVFDLAFYLGLALPGAFEVVAAPVHELQPVFFVPLDSVVHGRHWEVHESGDLGVREQGGFSSRLLGTVTEEVHAPQVHGLKNAVLHNFQWLDSHFPLRLFLRDSIEQAGQASQLRLSRVYRALTQVGSLLVGKRLQIRKHKLNFISCRIPKPTWEAWPELRKGIELAVCTKPQNPQTPKTPK